MYQKLASQIPQEFQLTEAEAVFLEAHEIHSVFHARQILQGLSDRKRKGIKVEQDKPLMLLAQVCQRVIQQPERFKKVYAAAFSHGLFNKAMATPARTNPYK